MDIERKEFGNRNCERLIREESISTFQPLNPYFFKKFKLIDAAATSINDLTFNNMVGNNEMLKSEAKKNVNFELKAGEKKIIGKQITFDFSESNKNIQNFRKENNVKSLINSNLNINQNNHEASQQEKSIDKCIREVDTFDLSLDIENSNIKIKEKISKKIRRVIEKVNEWRRQSQTINKGKYSKEEAAKIIGLKKKSLDDYLMYLRLGIVMSYDFTSNLDNKFGHLKKYVNGSRTNQKWNKIKHSDVDSLENLLQ